MTTDASDPRLPKLEPATITSTEINHEGVTNSEDGVVKKVASTKAEPQPLAVVAKTSSANSSARMMFGKFRRSDVSKAEVLGLKQGSESLQQPQTKTEDAIANHQTTNEATIEMRPEAAGSTEHEEPSDKVKQNREFVANVRTTMEKLIEQMDGLDPRKLLAVRLGGELRGLLGKAQDEFAAYEEEFVEHAANEGISVALQNFAASLVQVSTIAERLRTAKFMLNRTFKREVLFAFQEINSYYTSLFMELSMAVARRSGIELPLPAPVTLPVEIPAPSGDEVCLEAHQFFFGHGVAKNYRKALELYTQAANLGCSVAMTCLGQMYFGGQGTDKDLLVAQKYFEQAASAGEVEACHQLGLMLSEKATHQKNPRQMEDLFALARIRFTQAAEQGHCDAQHQLGVFNEHGRGGCAADEMEAAIWYLKAAEQGHTEAEASLGRLFLVGNQIELDVTKAVHFLQKAATKNDSSAQTRLGVLYITGNGVKQDMERGVAFLERAATSGSSVAMTRLASLLLLQSPPRGDTNSSIPPSYSAQFQDREESHDEALRLLLNAGNGGHTDAYYALGKLFESSTLLRDKSAALRFYSKAATSSPPHMKAAMRVATMYYSGIGCSVDKAKSHRFYSLAARTGDADALNALGLMHEEGDGCDLNFARAAECYRNAAEQENPYAHFNLGCLLSNGKGVPRNGDAAQAHFQKAVELGYSLAQQFIHEIAY